MFKLDLSSVFFQRRIIIFVFRSPVTLHVQQYIFIQNERYANDTQFPTGELLNFQTVIQLCTQHRREHSTVSSTRKILIKTRNIHVPYIIVCSVLRKVPVYHVADVSSFFFIEWKIFPFS